jgi:hypothetical protein
MRRIRDIAAQDDALGVLRRIGRRHGRQQGFRIWMLVITLIQFS